ASYRLAYGREGRTHLARRWPATVATPLALGAIVLLAWSAWDRDLALGPWSLGDVGRSAFTAAITAMYLSVGHHYVKQTYGCARVGAALVDLPFPATAARALRWALLATWLVPFVRANTHQGDFALFGVRHPSLGLPAWSAPAATAVLAVAAVTCAAVVV